VSTYLPYTIFFVNAPATRHTAIFGEFLAKMHVCHDCFFNCFRGYVSTAKGKIRQMKKDARRGCYMFVPAALAWTPPDHARQRLAALLVSAFAKTNGLSILLAQAALAVSRHRQPEVMHIVVGAGADGKSMVCVELMRACFSTAFANPACSVLQAHDRVRGMYYLFALKPIFASGPGIAKFSLLHKTKETDSNRLLNLFGRQHCCHYSDRQNDMPCRSSANGSSRHMPTSMP